MDSFLTAAYMEPGAAHVFVDVGQPYVVKEVASAQRIADAYGARFYHVKGADMGKYEHESGIIPFRNAELILNAAQFGDNIFMGVLKGEINSDKSPEFLRAMETVLNISHRAQYWTSGRTFRIHTPLDSKTKAQHLAELFESCEQAGDYTRWHDMLQTISCYSASDGHCGACPSCFKRWIALTLATNTDYGDAFDKHPATWHPLSYWESKGYPKERFAEIFAAYAIAEESGNV